MRHLDVSILIQFIKYSLVFGYIKSKAFLPIFVSRLKRTAHARFIIGGPNKFSGINIFTFIVRTIGITPKHINRTIRFFVGLLRISSFFSSAFISQSFLLYLTY